MAEIFQRVPWRSLKPTISGPKPTEKVDHFDAAPARHQEVAKLMKEHDNRQDEQKRHQIADGAAAECAQAPQNVTHQILVSAPCARIGSRCLLNNESFLRCLYGIFGQEVAGQTSRDMVNGQRRLDPGRLAEQAAGGGRLQRRLDQRRQWPENRSGRR